jgi:hypothetical protein
MQHTREWMQRTHLQEQLKAAIRAGEVAPVTTYMMGLAVAGVGQEIVDRCDPLVYQMALWRSLLRLHIRRTKEEQMC